MKESTVGNNGNDETVFFTWETKWKCILPLDKLIKRGRILINACYLYKSGKKTCNCTWALEFGLWTLEVIVSYNEVNQELTLSLGWITR